MPGLVLVYGPSLAVVIDDGIVIPPVPDFGSIIQRPAVEGGDWRWSVEISDPSAGFDVIWYDVTPWYAGDRYQRGADEYKGKYRASIATVQLQIDSDLLAPWGQDTTELFGADVRLGAGLLMRAGMVRVVSGVTVEWEPVWTGRVETWGDASAARGQIRTHVVTVIDVISDLANVPTVVLANTDTWDTYFTTWVLPQAGWVFGVDIYGDTNDSGMPFDDVPQAAINRMDAGTDPLGLVWRSLRNGRLVIHPAPWDTTNTARYPNPLLDVYPDGLVFTYSPEFTDVVYIADDEQQPFGIQRTVAGVLNSFQVTGPGDFGPETYAIDDPVSAGRYGVRPMTATWIIQNRPAVDDLMSDRAYAESQALPLRVTIDHEGFWPAMAIIDHLDPVTVIHQTNSDGGIVVTGTGVVRNIVEERTWRGNGLLSWQSTVQIDITATEVAESLLPVENLALLSTESSIFGGPSQAAFTWDNPVQPFITPTDIQYRVQGRSLIWQPKSYPGVGPDGLEVFWLEAATHYTFDVRLIRRVGRVIVASPVRSVSFTTPARIFVPIPDPDGTDTDVIADGPDDDCELEVELQENDGSGWVTVDTFTGAELTANGDGTYRLTTPIPNSFFEVGSVYRFQSREVCGGIPGPWMIGPSFDPPDDWTDPCTTPPALSVPPFDSDQMFVYIPQICAPDIIREYVSGIAGVKGDAYGELVALVTDPDYRALQAISQPQWDVVEHGIVAYGECPQIVGHTSDKTITVQTLIADRESVVLFECCGMQLYAQPGGTGKWNAGAAVQTVEGASSALSGDLDLDTPYVLTATYDSIAGTLILYVDGVAVDSSVPIGPAVTVATLPIWSVGAPPDSWITDAALFDGITIDPPAPQFVNETIQISGGGSYAGGSASMSINAADLVLGITAYRGFGIGTAPTMAVAGGGVALTGLAVLEPSTGFDTVSSTRGEAAVFRAAAATAGTIINNNGGGDFGGLHVVYRGAANSAPVQSDFDAADATDVCDIALPGTPVGRVVVLIAYGPTANGGTDNGPNLQPAAPAGWTKRADHSFLTKGFLCFEADTPQQTFTWSLAAGSGSSGGRAVYIVELPV